MSRAAGSNPGSGDGSRGAFLRVRDPDGGERDVALQGPVRGVGRTPAADLLLQSTTVSRRHAQFSLDGQGCWRVTDLGSRNGTLVNDQRVTEQVLASGDRVKVGDFELTFFQPDADPGAADSGAAGDPAEHTLTTTRGGVILSDARAGRLTALKDMEPPRVSALHLTALNDLSQKLLLTPDPGQRALELCRVMVGPQFRGHWSVLLRLPGPPAGSADGQAALPAPAPADGGQTADAPRPLCDPQSPPGAADLESGHAAYVSQSLLRAVSAKGEAMLASNLPAAAGPADVEMTLSPQVMAIAAIACPLRTDDPWLDVLYVTLPPQYGTGEWLALCSLAAKQYQQAESAWEARRQSEIQAAMRRELEQAKQIQTRLVPARAALDKHRAAGLDLAIGFVPSQAVGGDYADALAMKDGRVLLAVADVCGHGMAAALVAASVHTLVHAGVRRGAPLEALVEELNEDLCEKLPGGTFVTFVAVALDPGEGTIEYVNAGHPPLLAVGATGRVRRLDSGDNLPLGLDPGPMPGETGRVAADEFLLLYTDGLTEQSDVSGEMLGIEGLEAELGRICGDASGADLGAEAVARELSRRLDQRQGRRPPEDDRTFLVGRRR